MGQISVTTSKLTGSKTNIAGEDLDLKAALRANRDFHSMKLYVVDGPRHKILRFAKQDSLLDGPLARNDAFRKSIDSEAERLAGQLAQNHKLFEKERFVRNISDKAKAPVMLLAVRFRIPGHNAKFAMIITATDMTKIQISLPQSRTTLGYIVSADGKIFASSNEQALQSPSILVHHELVKKALQREAPSGFLPDFVGIDNKAKLGSFAQTPGGIRLFAVVERDRDAAFQVITRTYIRSALWGILILLIAAMVSFISANGITKNLRDLVVATAKIASGNFAVRVNPVNRDEVGELSLSVNNMAAQIQMLMSHEVEKAKFEKELETARMVQSTFFPKRDVVKTHLAVTGSYQPATQCGGDLWGHYTIKEGVELVFVADAMGHGAPAALVTAIAYAVCQSVSIFLQEKSSLDPSPAALLRRLNTIIMDAVDGKISMTFFVAVCDFNTGKLTFANAGHNFPIILTANKDDPRLAKSAKRQTTNSPTAAISLSQQGTPLGVERDLNYSEKNIDIHPGDKLVLFTDGLIENHLLDKDPIGRKYLLESIASWGDQNIVEIKNRTLELGQTHFGVENLQDDVTVVIAEVSKSWVKPSIETTDISSQETGLLELPTIPQAPVLVTQEVTLDSDSATLALFNLDLETTADQDVTAQDNAIKKPSSAV